MRAAMLELAPVFPGSSRSEAIDRALTSAAEAEEAGFQRFWFTEHHGAAGQASVDPVQLAALAGRETTRIRVGTGAVLVNHYSAFSVAERFAQLEATVPGRIDMGLGRATSGPVIDAALRRDRRGRHADDFFEQVQEIVAHLHGGFADNHPFGQLPVSEGLPTKPETWILGSSGSSAGLAGQLGVSYAFAGFLNPTNAGGAISAYREAFRPTRFGAGTPRAMLGINIVAAEDDDDAHRLTWVSRAAWARVPTGNTFLPTLTEAEHELPAAKKAESSDVAGARIPSQLSGTPRTLRDRIQRVVDATGATEIVVQDMLVEPGLRRRSREIVAAAISEVDGPS